MIECGLIQKVASGDMSDPKVRIARAAIEEFAMRSLDGARIREIAKKSGANVAAISYHFGGKKALYNAVVEGVSDYFEDSVKPFYDRGEAVFEKNDSRRRHEPRTRISHRHNPQIFGGGHSSRVLPDNGARNGVALRVFSARLRLHFPQARRLPLAAFAGCLKGAARPRCGDSFRAGIVVQRALVFVEKRRDS